jgi:hypothetical protein
MEHAGSTAIRSEIHWSSATDRTSATGGLPPTDDAMSASGLLRSGIAGSHPLGRYTARPESRNASAARAG